VRKITNERERFSLRLQQTLRNAHHSPDSPTELARDFNIRFAGRPITVHAARKWLVGEAIPTQDKMRTLAEWLHVPIDWLRFGGDESGSVPSATDPVFKSAELKMISDLQLLDEHHQMMVREFIRILLHANGRKRTSAKTVDEMPAAEIAMR
jgi:transcriptional regulator with XRE-family HTH domain